MRTFRRFLLVCGIWLSVLGVVFSADAANLLQNGDFSNGAAYWWTNGNDISTDTSSGAFCLTINSDEANPWDIQLGQSGIALQDGVTYRVTFTARADSNRDIAFKAGQSVSPYGNYFYETTAISTSDSEIATTFTKTGDDDSAQFEFHLGARGTGEICIDNVVIEDANATPLERDIVRNGGFGAGSAEWIPFTNNDALLDASVENGEMHLTVTQLGDNSYDAMLWQRYIPAVNGAQYSFQFAARADASRQLIAKVVKDAPNYDTYGGRTVNLTTQMQTFTIPFTMNVPTDSCAKIEFQVGDTLGDVFIDDVQLLTNAPPITTTVTYTTPSTYGATLRQLATTRGIMLGSAVDTHIFHCNSLHNAVLTTEFNSFTPANALKMRPLVPIRGQYQWSDADAMVNFAETNGMEFHGHALVWHEAMPDWADRTDISRADMIDILYEHIDTVVGRYAGRIAVWDVVNEAIDDATGGLRVTPWQQNIGDDYIALAFARARSADRNGSLGHSTAQLLYNDYLIAEMGTQKADAAYDLIAQLVLTDSVPIDGVGFQMHWTVDSPPDVQAVADNMARYAAIGVDVYITEIDVRVPDNASRAILDDAAAVYDAMLEVCLAAPNCDHFTTWGVSDIDSWIPDFFSGYGRAHIFDDNFDAKPAYHALAETLAGAPTAVEVQEVSSNRSMSFWWLLVVVLLVVIQRWFVRSS